MKYTMINMTIFIFTITLNIILFFIKNKKPRLISNKTTNYAILIPARDESKVIEKTLESIKKQNKNMSNTYVIIEDEKDPTYNIVKKFNANVFIRKKPIKHTKGNALDECLKEILKNKHYDLYFILDADNHLDKNFIKNMLIYYKEGYQVASGYRNISNPKKWVSICSGLLFSAQNNILNKYRSFFNQPLTLCGSGFYIDGKIIENLGGFPFYSLTEDFEFSIYMEDNNIPNIYVKDCVYYDEQPTTLNASIKQRTRWLKGVFYNTKRRKKNFFAFLSNLTLLSASLFLAFLGLELIIIFGIIKAIIYIYLITMLVTLFSLLIDNNKINLNLWQKVKCVIFNPVFLLSYIICIPKALFKKNIKWDKTEHMGK